jgi:hypothetical protein
MAWLLHYLYSLHPDYCTLENIIIIYTSRNKIVDLKTGFLRIFFWTFIEVKQTINITPNPQNIHNCTSIPSIVIPHINVLGAVVAVIVWIYNYLWNQCLSPLMLWVRISIRARCTTLCDKVCQWLATGRCFSVGPRVSSINKTDCHNVTEILISWKWH